MKSYEAFTGAARKPHFGVLTPYLVPESMTGKVVNLGDGFILTGIERILGAFDQELVLSTREAPSPERLQMLAGTKALILGGANQLNDHYSVWPGLTPEALERLNLTLVPFGVGLDGAVSKNIALSESTKQIIEIIHRRIEYSSWRCPRTVAALESALPSLKGRFLMTGCPVLYDHLLLESSSFASDTSRVAVTVTERGDFFEREAATLKSVAKEFPAAERFLVLHQDFRKLNPGFTSTVRSMLPTRFLKKRDRLHRLAETLGYQLIVPRTAVECMEFYRRIDLHVGSRLHAHLMFLSTNKRSFLTYVDNRCLGFSEFLGFPLIDPTKLDSYLDFDFEIVRRAAQESYETMTKFTHSLPN